MNRYQIYLNPNSVSVFDWLARELDVSRSQITRDILDRVALQYQKVIAASEAKKLKINPLLQMIGAGKSTKKNVADNVDEIYSRD